MVQVQENTAWRRIRRTGTFRVGYPQMTPWSVRLPDQVAGLDVSLCRDMAASLGAKPTFIQCRLGELRSGLRVGALDLAIGGLVDQGYEDISCISVPLDATAVSKDDARTVYQSVWWTRRDELQWKAWLRAYLLVHRLRCAVLGRSPATR